MSENEQEPAADEKQPNEDEVKSEVEENTAPASVKKGSAGIILVIILSLAWYLAADRFTPYTQQARVQGFVIGVAPKVGGVVTRVWVRNDEMVTVDQSLFEIDRSQYEIALKRAESELQNTISQIGAGPGTTVQGRCGLYIRTAPGNVAFGPGAGARKSTGGQS